MIGYSISCLFYVPRSQADKGTDINDCSPNTAEDTQDSAKRNKFEFEKWVRGETGAEDMYHNPGSPGANADVDGIIPFRQAEKWNETPKTARASVPVKGGKAHPVVFKLCRQLCVNIGIME